MTREEREAAITHIKGYRKLDENLHNTAPKDSISYYATAKCLKYWDMAIKALEQESCEDMVHIGTLHQVMWERDVAIEQLKELGYGLGQKIEPCEDAISRDAVLKKQYRIDDSATLSTRDVVNVEDIEDAPSVTPSRGWEEMTVPCENCGHDMTFKIAVCGEPSRHKGHWVHKGQGIYCSECGKESGYNPFGASRFSDYCPSCGIEMESEE